MIKGIEMERGTMKKLNILFMTLLMLFSIHTITLATEVTPQNPEKTIIKVGYLENYGIINTPSIRGAEGFGFEYLEEIEKHTNYQFTFVSTTWVEGFEMLERGEIDLFGTASMNEERKERVEFVETPICYESACIYAPIETELYYDDPAGLNGLTIGMTKGSVYREVMEKYTAEHNLDLTIKFTETTDFMSYIESGEIDIFLAGSLLQVHGTKIIEELYDEPLYFISTKGNQLLCENIEKAILDIEKSTPYFNEILWYKYYGNNQKANKSITQDENLALSKKDVYTVGYHADLHPISYITENDEPRGYAIDVMNILADQLGITVTYLPLHGEEDNHPKDVDFNLCPMHGECATHGHFTNPYDLQDLLVIRDYGIKKNEVQDIVVPDFSTIAIEDFLYLYPSATIHKSSSSTDNENINKEINPDCKIVPEGSEMLIIDKNNKNISVLDASVPMGIMVSDQLPNQVLTALNKAIDMLPKGVVDELILENVLLMKPELTILDVIVKYQYPILLFFLLIIGGVLLILWKINKKTKELLEVDTLTGAFTKYKFLKDVANALANAIPNEYMLILLDIDNFKGVNKNYGIEKGDQLLCAITKSLKKHVSSDAIMGRIQNDVFAVFMKNKDIPKIPIDEMLEQEIRDLGLEYQIYFSVGVYPIENPKEQITDILDNAKAVKNIGKSTFGNTLYVYTKELKNKFEKTQVVLSSMEKALVNKEFFILIQPKVELQTLKLTGGEVLVRWKRKEGTFIYPDEFIPIFEENQFIEQLDAYVFEQTCIFIKNANVELPLLSVNISAVSLLKENVVERYLEIVDTYGIKPQQLELELTESAIESNFGKIQDLISKFKSFGFHIAIDDFGKGESSLTRIKELAVDTIKLDKGFIDNKIETEKDRVFLTNLIKMIHGLGYSTLTEGVETENQRKLLLNMGCEYGQGYLFDRPIPTEDFLSRVENNAKEEFPKVEQQIEKNKKAIRDIELLPYSVIVVTNDASITVIEANEAFYTLIGYTKKEFLLMCGNSFKEMVAENIVEILDENANQTDLFDAKLHLSGANLKEVLVHAYMSYKEEQNTYTITLMT